MSEDAPADIGSLREEAARLFGTLADLARGQGGDLGSGWGSGWGGAAAHAADALREVEEHLATDDAECTYCPLCRAAHLVRETSPEVRAHLSSAAASLAQAAAALFATATPDRARAGATGVERIDLDDDSGRDPAGPGAAPRAGTGKDDEDDLWAEDE